MTDRHRDDRRTDPMAADTATTGRLARLEDLDDFEIADGEPDIRGWKVRTTDGHEVGTVDTLIADTNAMAVRYLEVKVNDDLVEDKAAHQYVLVPIGAARLDEDDDAVFIDRLPPTGFRGAPMTARTPITAEHEQRVRAFYGPAFTAGGHSDSDTDYYDHARFFGKRRHGRAGADYLTRSEEELAIGKRAVQQGEVDVHKRVETEHVRREVPVSHEEVHVERRPASPGASASPTMREGELHVPVMGEEVVVEKRAVPKEEIVISRETVRDTKTVEADLKKERVEVDRHRANEARRDR